jgi:hypothetical protein
VRRVAAIVLAGTALTGCGSSQPPRPAQPKLPILVAEQLALQSEKVAAALDGGDGCRARDAAQRLQRETVDAINDRRIPGPFHEHLAAAVNDLVSRITCVPPVEEEHGEGKGKGKHKGRHKGHD